MMLGNSAGVDKGLQMESSERQRARDRVSVGGHAFGEQGGGSSWERGAQGGNGSQTKSEISSSSLHSGELEGLPKEIFFRYS